jgi:organic hydroperoxide reductase OsmC/OhrA
MLSFLAFAAKEGFVVDTYRDDAEGVLARDASGGSSISVVGLRPRITFAGGRRPTPAEFEAFHHESHESCFIARSVESEVRWVAAFQRRGQADRKSVILMHE